MLYLLRSHIAMDFRNAFADLFSFQFLNSQGEAIAGADLEDGKPVRVYYVDSLKAERLEIIRWTIEAYKQARA